MINKSEINRLAIEKRVKTSTIDKDWVLGHFTDAIFSIPACRKNLVFKGGTCLKKCRFPDYRFSEDLDFTSKNDAFVFDLPMLEQITALVKGRTEMPLHIQSVKELRFNDKLTGYSARIKYWGADHRKDQQLPEPARWLTSIKIEIILYEIMIFESETKNIHHPYSDALSENALHIPVYSINEVLAEKLRALIQRSYTAPRDYYDIWYLNRNNENIDWQKVIKAFHAKTAYKGLQFTGVGQLISPQNDKLLKAAWKNSLEHQVSSGYLPEYDEVRYDLLMLFTQIFNENEI
jgi:predicted nucleotidyltransferase component of viral defense system